VTPQIVMEMQVGQSARVASNAVMLGWRGDRFIAGLAPIVPDGPVLVTRKDDGFHAVVPEAHVWAKGVSSKVCPFRLKAD